MTSKLFSSWNCKLCNAWANSWGRFLVGITTEIKGRTGAAKRSRSCRVSAQTPGGGDRGALSFPVLINSLQAWPRMDHWLQCFQCWWPKFPNRSNTDLSPRTSVITRGKSAKGAIIPPLNSLAAPHWGVANQALPWLMASMMLTGNTSPKDGRMTKSAAFMAAATFSPERPWSSFMRRSSATRLRTFST